MHTVYSNPEWQVCRLLAVPEDALNATPYLKRGWCFFESGVSIAGAQALLTLRDGEFIYNEPSPVPLPPVRFAEQVRRLHFTSARTDPDDVVQLYQRIFPKLAEKERLIVYAWSDAEVYSKCLMNRTPQLLPYQGSLVPRPPR